MRIWRRLPRGGREPEATAGPAAPGAAALDATVEGPLGGMVRAAIMAEAGLRDARAVLSDEEAGETADSPVRDRYFDLESVQ